MALLVDDMYPGFDDDMIQRLRIINVNTIFDFVNEDTEKLGRIMKMPYQEVKKFKAQIVETFGGKIRSGTELLSIQQHGIVSTGIESFDILLNGGLHPGELYELCGVSSAGKTQLCLTLAVNVVLHTSCPVRYIDTKNDFSASRVHAILEANGHDDERTAKVMNQIRVNRATNINELSSVLYDLTRSLKSDDEENERPTKLLIIDSLPAIILASSDSSESFCQLNNLAGVSRFIANECSLPIVTVNLISEWRDTVGFGKSVVEKPATVKPNLGKFWLHVPNTRLIMEKLEHEERKISVWKSAGLRADTSCTLRFGQSGVN